MNVHRHISLVLNIVLLTVLSSYLVKCGKHTHGSFGEIEYETINPRMIEKPEFENRNISIEKEKSDIQTVKQNFYAYNNLMNIDAKNLSSKQQEMLHRIVERVARLKSVLESDEPKNQGKHQVFHGKELPFDSSNTTAERLAEKLFALESNVTKIEENEHTRSNEWISGTTKSDADNILSTLETTTPIITKQVYKRGSNFKIKTKHQAFTKPTASMGKQPYEITTEDNPFDVSTSPKSLKSESVYNNKVANNLENSTKQHDKYSDQIAVADKSASTGQITEPIKSQIGYDFNASSVFESISSHAREDLHSKELLNENNAQKKPTAGAKPTKYHYYPHNQHIYLLPECAIQQVCNAVYVRLNYTQPLCACPSRYRDPCSASLNEDDQHTTKLVGNSKKKAITLAKTCESTTEMRQCRSPKDWSLLALQNTRTGKSHFLVICRCPDNYKLEGPMAHDQPTYASVPGIRVFGMMCVSPGYSIQKPIFSPTTTYQLQNPYSTASINHYLTKKPTNHDNSYQSHQNEDHYLTRPESSSTINASNPQQITGSISLSNFDIYGRNNEKNEMALDNTQTREKRYVLRDDDPPFPWDRLKNLQNFLQWN